jgi:hypothetical protein
MGDGFVRLDEDLGIFFSWLGWNSGRETPACIISWHMLTMDSSSGYAHLVRQITGEIYSCFVCKRVGTW